MKDYKKIREVVKKYIQESDILRVDPKQTSSKIIDIIGNIRRENNEVFREVLESELFEIIVEEIQKLKCDQIDENIEKLPFWINKKGIQNLDMLGKIIFVELIMNGHTVEEFDEKKYFAINTPIKSELKKRLLEYRKIIQELKSEDILSSGFYNLINYLIGVKSEEIKDKQGQVFNILESNSKNNPQLISAIKNYRFNGEIYPTLFILNRVDKDFIRRKTLSESIDINIDELDEIKKSVNSIIDILGTMQIARTTLYK